MQKLGVKPKTICWVSKGFDRAFFAELKTIGATITRSVNKCGLAFLYLEDRGELPEIKRVADLLPPKINLWIVYPKGDSRITQANVMTATQSLGMGPSKTAAFDDKHSSMRFTRKVS
jgi:hypothetical protein